MVAYFRPNTLDEALELRAGRPVTVLAGGTDVYPARTTRAAWGSTAHGDVLDITGLSHLRDITSNDAHWRIGALTTWSDIVRASLPPAFDGLKRAALEIGGRQIQNRGTLAGNICNASPAADGVPMLLALDAQVELTSILGQRTLTLSEFIDGYRHTACRPDEIVTGIIIAKLPEASRGHFLKLGARRSLVISTVMVAVVLVPLPGTTRIADARIAVGACTPVARRISSLEAALMGQPIDEHLADRACPNQFAKLAPIDDVRASAAYRQSMALEVTRETLRQIATGQLRRLT